MSSNLGQIIQKVLNETDIERDDLLKEINHKQKELDGFITPEGAATIVARKYGITLEKGEPEVRKLRIEDLSIGMSSIDVVGRVALIYGVREFEHKDGSPGKVASLLLKDRTGKIRTILWDEKAVLIEEGDIEKGSPVRFEDAYVKRGLRNNAELNLGHRGKVEIFPDDERAKDLPPIPDTKVKILDLTLDFEEVDVVGRVIAVTKPRTFERKDGSGGKVASLMFADETGQTRVSLWDDKADLSSEVSLGDAIKLENAYVREGWKNGVELHVGSRGRIIFNPPKSETKGLPEFERKFLKIEEIEPDLPLLDIVARVHRLFQPQNFDRDDGTQGQVMNVILADETGTIRSSFWNGKVDIARNLSPNDVVLIRGARSRMGLGGKPEIRIGGEAQVEVNPANIKIEKQESGPIKIGELESGLDSVEIVGRVTNISEPREFTKSDGRQGRVISLNIGDETGTARVALWNEKVDLGSEIEVGDTVRILDCYTTAGIDGRPEIQVSAQGKLKISPEFEEILPPLKEIEIGPIAERVDIGEIKKEGNRVRVRGTIVRVFHRRPLFDVCPDCGRSLGSVDSSLLCEECGKVVAPKHRVVINIVIDDGTGNMRAVAFGEVGEELLGMPADEVFELFNKSSDLAEVYENFDLAGREVELTGITRRDKRFDQLELRITQVKMPSPEEEARDLLEEIKA